MNEKKNSTAVLVGMKNKRKRQRRRYDRISLHYVNLSDGQPESFAVLNQLNEWRVPQSCNLGLQLEINGKVIWKTCLISSLVDIVLGRAEHLHGVPEGPEVENIEHGSADYSPFVCFECGDDGCAGVWVPLRVFQCGEDIIFGIKRPFDDVVEPGKKRKFRAYRFQRRDFLDTLIDAVKFRISLENMMQKYSRHNLTDNSESCEWLKEIFGLSVCEEYQQRISKALRDDFPRLLDLRLSMLQ